jgi:hypothetical protein
MTKIAYLSPPSEVGEPQSQDLDGPVNEALERLVIDAEEFDVVGFSRVKGPISDQTTDDTESFEFWRTTL